jgi:hypothetical protein
MKESYMSRSQPRFARTVGVSVRYGPGEEPLSWTPGDFLVIHSESWHNRLIQFAQGRAMRAEARRYAYWDHSAIVVSRCGELVESVSSLGVARSPARKYRNSDYHVVTIDASAEARRLAVQYAEWAADQGTRYGWWSIASIVSMMLSRGRFSFHVPGQETCSGLVARSLERAGALFRSAPSHIMPAELAFYYGVDPPAVRSLTI